MVWSCDYGRPSCWSDQVQGHKVYEDIRETTKQVTHTVSIEVRAENSNVYWSKSIPIEVELETKVSKNCPNPLRACWLLDSPIDDCFREIEDTHAQCTACKNVALWVKKIDSIGKVLPDVRLHRLFFFTKYSVEHFNGTSDWSQTVGKAIERVLQVETKETLRES